MWTGSSRIGVGLAALALATMAGCAASSVQQRGDGGPGGPDAGLCGNNALDPGEECDDGNTVSGDGCSPSCETEVCDSSSCPWGCCDPYGACVAGTQDLQCGAAGVDCADCQTGGEVCDAQSCIDLGPCTPEDTLPCGNCGTRTCTAASVWGTCEGQGECGLGQQESTGLCGNCGQLQRSCLVNCVWSGLECVDEGSCALGDVEQGAACGECSVEERACQADCTWGDWVCVAYQECTPGASEPGAACGDCGTEERLCQTDCTWGPFTCQGEGECGLNDTTTTGCSNCQRKYCTPQCTWGPCESPTELCNGSDDDCDGQCDETFQCCLSTTGSCTTSCGSTGTHTCGTGCTWGTCQAPSETCNGVDDDCDGAVDDGFRADSRTATYSGSGSLDDYHASCTASQGWSLACNYAIHAWCQAQNPGCLNSGYGPVEINGDNATVNCVAGAAVMSVGFGTLSSIHAGCTASTPVSDSCYYAIHHHCMNQGYDSGFGPITASGSDLQLACINNGTVINTTYSAVAAYHAPCDGITHSWDMDCNAAIKRYCTGNGHTGGYGPVSHVYPNLTLVCIDP